MKIRKTDKSDLGWIKDTFNKEWEGDYVISLGKKHYPENLQGFIAEEGEERVGLLTYELGNREIELTSLNSFRQNQGIGTSLIKCLINTAREIGYRRIWVVTENSNLNALVFYQKRGFVFKAVYVNSFEKIRKIKPQIPKLAENGIPIRDEIELELAC